VIFGCVAFERVCERVDDVEMRCFHPVVGPLMSS